MKKDPIGSSLLFVYILSLFASHLIFPPLFSHRFQPSEAVFLITVIFYHKLFLNRIAYWQFVKKAWPILLYLGVIVLMSIIQPSEYAFYKSTGTLYLALVAFLFYHKGGFLIRNMKLWGRIMAILSLLLSLPVFTSYILLSIQGFEPLGLIEAPTYYPIIGLYGRPEGFHISPTMLVAVVQFPLWSYILALRNKWELQLWQHIAFVSVLIMLLFTFNKELFLILAILLAFFVPKIRDKKWLAVSLFTGVICIQQLLIHFIPIQPGSLDQSTVYQGFTNCLGSPLFEILSLSFYESHYALIRIVEFSILPQHWFIGMGLGNFPEAFASFDPDSVRYADCFNFEVEPHNTFLGLWIEMGVLGLISSILLFAQPLYQLYQNLRQKIAGAYLLLFLFILTYALMGLSTDVEDFRLLWVVLGLSFGVVGKPKCLSTPFENQPRRKKM